MMLSDGLGVCSPEQLEGFAMGRPLDDLDSGLLVLHLPEWRWLRRTIGSCVPPRVLVWLPGPGLLPADMACLAQLREEP
jgi:hypothetical protein